MPPGRVLFAWLVTLSACGGDEAPAPPTPPAARAEPEPPAPPTPSPPAEPDAELLAAYPSLAHYPGIPFELASALRAREARAIFRGLVLAFASTRWANADDWERLAHIRIAAPAGFCRTENGAPIPLPRGTHDLGCLGGFLEAVRMLYLPRVELEELVSCDPPAGFESCADGAHAGRGVLLQIGARLPPEALPRGLELRDQHAEREYSDLLRALEPDALHLCTVSHRAAARDGERMYHHMMIVDPVRERHGRIRVFDTTGNAGVAYRPMRPERLHHYVHRLLAINDTYRYDPDSAQLTCLAVRRPEDMSSQTGP